MVNACYQQGRNIVCEILNNVFMQSVAIERQSRVEHSNDWNEIIAQFPLDPEYTHLGTSQFLSSHSFLIQNSISAFAKELDKNPVTYTLQNEQSAMQEVRDALNKYFNVGDA